MQLSALPVFVAFCPVGLSSPGISSSSSQGQQKGTSAGKEGGGDYGSKGAQPKILSDNPPASDDPSVRQHNKEMEQRAERACMQASNEDAKYDKGSKGRSSSKSPKNASFWASLGLAVFVAGNWVYMGSGPREGF